ncbi:MAG: hypothetical protein ACE5EH_13010 [Gammaproteobacteria bacterium]
MKIQTIPLSSNEILQELITQSLEELLGQSFNVISNNLPYTGNHILAMDSCNRPTLISYDNRDGGQALLSGLAAMDGLTNDRAWLYKVYPSLFNDNPNSTLNINDIQLNLLSPTAPPGAVYLSKQIKNLNVYLFNCFLLNGEYGLLIEPYQIDSNLGDQYVELRHSDESVEISPFRSGELTLTPEEETYFQQAL